jgi:hypothetical protein
VDELGYGLVKDAIVGSGRSMLAISEVLKTYTENLEEVYGDRDPSCELALHWD